jgi:hypothetical protein
MVWDARGWAWGSYRATAGLHDAPERLDASAVLALFDRNMPTHREAYQTAVYLLRRAANEPLQTVAIRLRKWATPLFCPRLSMARVPAKCFVLFSPVYYAN